MRKAIMTNKAITAHTGYSRSRVIPAGSEIELTDVLEDGMRRIYWPESTEGMGFVVVDEGELQSAVGAMM